MLSSFNSKGLCEQKRYVKRLKKYLCETYEHKVHYHKFVIDLHLNWDYKLPCPRYNNYYASKSHL